MKITCDKAARVLESEDRSKFSEEEIEAAGEHLESCQYCGQQHEFVNKYAPQLAELLAQRRYLEDEAGPKGQPSKPLSEWGQRVLKELERKGLVAAEQSASPPAATSAL